MKKIIPVLGVLAGAAAFVAYKMKKDEQKQIVDLDQGLLEDEDETIEEGPISNPEGCYEDMLEKAEELSEDAQAKVKHLKERTGELLDDTAEKAEDVKDAFKVHLDDVKDAAVDIAEEVKKAAEEAKDDIYTHLGVTKVAQIKQQADDMINMLVKEGDVHAHERPVQHKVRFSSAQDLEAFKNTVINKGFVITNGEDENELLVLHISSINKDKLYDNMLTLADAAEENYGVYEGWTSKVVY